MSENTLLVIRLVAAFVVAGTFVVTMAWVAERFGSKLGGFLLALPATSVVALVVIAIAEGQAAVREVATPMPLTFAASAVFLMIFARLSGKGLVVAYSGAISVWLLIAIPVAVFDLNTFSTAVIVAVALLALVTWSFRHTPHRRAKPVGRSARLMAVRFVIAGSVTAAAILASALLGPLWAAVFASFPAAFTSSLILLTHSQGIQFAASLGRTMAVGSITSVLFAASLYLYSASFGGLTSIALAYLTTLVLAAVSYRYVLDLLGSRQQPTSA